MQTLTELHRGEFLKQMEDFDRLISLPNFIEKITRMSACEQEHFFMIMELMSVILIKIKRHEVCNNDLEKFNLLTSDFFENLLIEDYRNDVIMTLAKFKKSL